MNRLHAELRRVFGDPVVAPRAVVRVQIGDGQGLESAYAEADRLVDAGADLVVLDSEVTSDAVLTCLAACLDLEPVAVCDGLTDDWSTRVVAVRSALREAKTLAAQPIELLAHLDDAALSRTAGLLARLGARRTAVVCGGGAATAAAALVASRLEAGAAGHWLAGSTPALPAAARAWRSLGLEPLLDLGLTSDSADVAIAVVRSGLELLGA